MLWQLVGFLASLGLGLSIIALMGSVVVGIIFYGNQALKVAIDRIKR